MVPDPRDLELRERGLETLSLERVAPVAETSALELTAQAQLHLPRREIGERDRHHLAESRASRAKERDQPRDQHGGLTRSRRRLDDEAPVELGDDAISRARVV